MHMKPIKKFNLGELVESQGKVEEATKKKNNLREFIRRRNVQVRKIMRMFHKK